MNGLKKDKDKKNKHELVLKKDLITLFFKTYKVTVFWLHMNQISFCFLHMSWLRDKTDLKNKTKNIQAK